MSQETLPPAVATPAEAPQSNGVAVAGFVLAILFAPVGLILSIVGLVKSGKVGGKGRVLSVFGIIISLAFIGAGTAVAVVVTKEVVKVTQPGCINGKSAILDNSAKLDSDATKVEGFQATIKGLNDAAAEATDPQIRDAMKATADDYQAALDALQGKAERPADF